MQIWRIFVAGKSDTIASSPTSASDMGQSCWHSFNFAWAVAAYEAGSGTGHATGNHKSPGGGACVCVCVYLRIRTRVLQ